MGSGDTSFEAGAHRLEWRRDAQIQQTEREKHFGRWGSVARFNCSIGRDRRGSRSKDLRVTARYIGRHGSHGQLQRSVGIQVR